MQTKPLSLEQPDDPPVHQHFEQTEHPGGNPNNIEHTTQDVVNDNRNGVHSNIVQHVSISNNRINGQPTMDVARGRDGVSFNGQGNKLIQPDDLSSLFMALAHT
ncbi:hypothetical protein H4R18_004336 [Coemansia javaensis]|uniref:Uncharacterized protein n=1 Tax=Coemansia javaensis TaxID=2761396 RepID=A0A9W8LFX9_9FUNG|nr:hypothetical protein H4R18_004336 [Coemansia javaensis]